MDEVGVREETKPQLQTFGREWLAAGAYTLDIFSAVWNVPLTMNEQPSSFAEVFNKLRNSKIKEMPDVIGGRYVTEEGEIQLDCKWPLKSTMRTLIEFTRQGIEPHHVRWFYYAHDWSLDADRHTFFAVHDDKIVMESCDFSSEQPLILKKRTAEDEPIWRSHEYFDEAFEIYWYRKFYMETMMGQLMVLRPDEPILYHYERPQTRGLAQEIQFVTQLKMYRLLWVAIPLLVALAFPSLKDYMAIAAIALGVSFLWLCWETRKVGWRGQQ
jgi:hypothetical protein